ncbi:MAG: hypothetical protein M1308_14060, partial [Actinobacteria bacterium]|nr:hypothetical protein [Actinomycetota bacterium]
GTTPALTIAHTTLLATFAGAINGATTVTAGTGITATTGDIVASAGNISTSIGSITSAASLTATSGNITATSGNLIISNPANGIQLNILSNAGASPVTLDGLSGIVTFTGISIAAGATQTITINNSSVGGSSTRVLYWWEGATTGSALSLQSMVPSAGAMAFTFTNGAGATTSTADIKIGFIQLTP